VKFFLDANTSFSTKRTNVNQKRASPFLDLLSSFFFLSRTNFSYDSRSCPNVNFRVIVSTSTSDIMRFSWIVITFGYSDITGFLLFPFTQKIFCIQMNVRNQSRPILKWGLLKQAYYGAPSINRRSASWSQGSEDVIFNRDSIELPQISSVLKVGTKIIIASNCINLSYDVVIIFVFV